MSLDFDLCGYLNVGPVNSKKVRVELYSNNITHNLGKMAEAAGLYEPLWNAEENGYKKGADVIPLLREGLAKLKDDPEKYKALNAPNGWGTYKYFVPFVANILEACERYPRAIIEVSK